MNVIGIVAEYNPFHTGHGYQIAQSRLRLGENAPVVVVMSGNWTQQADCAIADKWTRARLALMGGADLVLELPTPWATASAERFAQGAIALLCATGLVTHLSFGSECGDAGKLSRVAACLDSPAYHAEVSRLAGEGLPFALCRQKAVEAVLGAELGGLLSKPNNNLGIEYLRALNAFPSSIRPITVQRQGAAHNSVTGVLVRQSDGSYVSGPAAMDMPRFVSATQIRMHLMDGQWDMAEDYLVPGGRSILEHGMVGLPHLEQVGRAMLLKVRTMTAADWAALPDSGAAEGLPQRLEKAGRQCASMKEFFDLVKTKRYTHARLRRLVLWAYLGLTQSDFPSAPAYLRVLGFTPRGQALLKEMKSAAALPVLTKPAHARQLSGEALEQFEREARCTDLYGLCFPSVPAPGQEWTHGPVLLDPTGGRPNEL